MSLFEQTPYKHGSHLINMQYPYTWGCVLFSELHSLGRDRRPVGAMTRRRVPKVMMSPSLGSTIESKYRRNDTPFKVSPLLPM